MKGAGIALVCGVVLALGAFGACGGSPTADDVARDGGNDSNSADDGSKGVIGSDSGGDAAGDGAGADGEGDASDVGDAEASVDSAPMIDANGPPFGCGTGSLECYEVTEFCSQVTGPHGGVFYNCIAAPAACATDVSCACLAAQSIVGTCTEEDGGIAVAVTEP